MVEEVERESLACLVGRYGDAVDIKRAADLYAQGWSLRQIAAELGVPWTAVGCALRWPQPKNASYDADSSPY
jgi:hypothetical protein